MTLKNKDKFTMENLKYNSIRSYEDSEVQEVIDRLLNSKRFCEILAKTELKGIKKEDVIKLMKSSETILDFQKNIVVKFVEFVMSECVDSIDLAGYKYLDKEKNYTFISNHRDIVMDSAFLDYLLIGRNMNSVEIAIGDNLFAYPWIEDLTRLNRSFVVKRGLAGRQQLVASAELSSYMHYVIDKKKHSIWLAQREGRAKNSDDRTQESILKMLNLGGEGSVFENISSMNIVPVSISYEYDPCDFLKAAEMQLKRDIPDYHKSRQDDVVSMVTGMMGYKGRIFYKLSPCLSDIISKMDGEMKRNDFFEKIAKLVDSGIHSNYHIYPSNYIACDMINGLDSFSDCYSASEKQKFSDYIEKQLTRINIPNKDNKFLKKHMLEMYANPLKNKIEADKYNK